MGEDELAKLVTRDAMVGTAKVLPPNAASPTAPSENRA